MNGEVGVRHRAGGEGGGGAGEQADEDQGSADELDESGVPAGPGAGREGVTGAPVPAEHAEHRRQAVEEEQQSDDDPEQGEYRVAESVQIHECPPGCSASDRMVRSLAVLPIGRSAEAGMQRVSRLGLLSALTISSVNESSRRTMQRGR
jgi:hypothetical protein